MIQKLILCAMLSLAAMATTAHAGTIDSLPAGGPFGSPGPGATVGGTFTADDVRLDSFTLNAREIGATQGAMAAAVVFATDGGGVPTGAPIWQSALFAPLPSNTQVPTMTFTPGIALTPGQNYYVGIDWGAFVAGTSGDIEVFLVLGDHPQLPTGDLYFNVGGGQWQGGPGIGADIAATIVMNPEPSTLALFGVALLGGAGLLRRRRKGRVETQTEA